MRLLILAVAALAAAPAIAQEKMAACNGANEECRKIVEMWQNFAMAVNKQDAAATAALFSEDGAAGRQAIERRVSDDLKAGFSKLADTVDEVHVSNDMAWVVGHWTCAIAGEDGTSQPLKGRWGSVHVRDGDSWRIRMSTPNLDTSAEHP